MVSAADELLDSIGHAMVALGKGLSSFAGEKFNHMVDEFIGEHSAPAKLSTPELRVVTGQNKTSPTST